MTSEQIQRLYKDALYFHFRKQGYSMKQAEAMATQRIQEKILI